MKTITIHHGSIVQGPTLPEPIEVLATVPMGDSLKVIGRGMQTGMTHDPVLNPEQLAQLIVSAEQEPFDGDARLFRLGVEAHRLGLAYEYDPYFSLSIARVDPLPHQLEAVYGYFLRLPRIRFLLADDPGAGKTIMGGLTAQGTQGPRTGQAHANRHPRKPDLSVAAGDGRQVPREIRGHPRCLAPCQLRPEPLAGARSGHHICLLGLIDRRRP